MVNVKKQSGVVLVAAMIMLLLVTGVAVTLMSNSTLDSKMVGASQQAAAAENDTKGDSERAIQAQLAAAGNSNFLKKPAQFAGNTINISPNANTQVLLSNENDMAVADLLDCPPRFAVTKGIKCNYLRVQANHTYGKGNRHSVTVHTGIQQEMIEN